MEGSGVGSAGWVVLGVECMLMCMGSEICCGWLQYSCYTEHGRYGLCIHHTDHDCHVHIGSNLLSYLTPVNAW